METEKKMTYIHEEREPEKEKILIVSYSYSGNTHRIAGRFRNFQTAICVKSIRGSLIPCRSRNFSRR